MAVATVEFHELVRLLETNPQWRADLRQVLLPQRFRDLPEVVKELGANRIEATTDRQRIWEEIRAIAERTERGFAEAAAARAEAAADRKRIWEAIKEGFAEATAARAEAAADRLEIWKSIERMTSQILELTKTIGKLKGLTKEIWYQRRATSIFGIVFSGGHEVTNQIADRLYEAQKQGVIPEKKRVSVLAADLLWGGRLRENGQDIVVVLEASWLVEEHDVERAEQRAKILRHIGVPALPVVAGEEWGDEIKASARWSKVAMIENGKLDLASWRKALGNI